MGFLTISILITILKLSHLDEICLSYGEFAKENLPPHNRCLKIDPLDIYPNETLHKAS